MHEHLTLGMVFVLFPAADVAADAVDKFKSSTVDNKQLFVRVLPNIHVSIHKLQKYKANLRFLSLASLEVVIITNNQ